MQKIIPHIWFDEEAKEAANFYASAIPNSQVKHVTTLNDTPSGSVDTVVLEIGGQEFQFISGGPLFKVNPSISFMLNFDPSRDPDAEKNLNKTWDKLSDGGVPLMPIQEYPFSKRYGWVQDKYGVSWQLILTNPEGEERPFVIPSLLFVGDVCGKAEEAREFYVDIFKNSRKGEIAYYPAGMDPDKEGTVMFSDFMVENTWLTAMDSARMHDFSFNEAISLMVVCGNQEEIDYYWEKLSAVPEAEQCGWLKDKYGLSWQIVPTVMNEMMTQGSEEQIARVTQAFLQMKKFDVARLQDAYDGK